MQVKLTHVLDNKPVDIDLVFGSGGRYLQSGGRGASSSLVRIPDN